MSIKFNIAVAWFGAAFITTAINPEIGLLKFAGFIANMFLLNTENWLKALDLASIATYLIL